MKTKKKIIMCCILLAVIASMLIIYKVNSRDNFQEDIPAIIVSNDNVKYKTVRGDGNWASINPPDGNIPGNGYIVDINKEFTENCSFIKVHPGDELKFDISYKQNIQKVTLDTIDFTTNERQNVLLLDEPYSFKSPEEKKDCYYILNVIWDENHNFDYLFKIKVV